jgi:hypothetical protein
MRIIQTTVHHISAAMRQYIARREAILSGSGGKFRQEFLEGLFSRPIGGFHGLIKH